MLYQIGLVLILIVVALVISKKFKTTDDNESLVYEDDMSSDELEKLDDEIN